MNSLVSRSPALPQWLVGNMLLPLHERLRGRRTTACYQSLRASERLHPDALRALQDEKLRRLLVHCWHQVPFYRHQFEQLGITHPDALDRAVLARLPVLERHEVRARLDALLARDDPRPRIRHSTGGSTGEPLVFFTDPDKESWHNAAKLRGRAWFGIEPGSRQVDFWGSPVELSKQDAPQRIKDRWLLNQIVLSALDLGDVALARHARLLRRFQPRLIYGYPTVLYHVALFIERHPDALGDWRPALVSCTSEVLDPQQRAKIGAIFQCPVASEYGARDGGHLAHECPAGKLHIAAEHALLEIDSPDTAGEGDLLVTNLDGYAMPLLRYRLGDRASLRQEPCSCGLSLPCLGEILGRRSDFIVGRDDQLVHRTALMGILRDLPGLKQFRVIQRRDLSLEILLVRDGAFSESELARIRQQMQAMMRLDLPIRFAFPEQIPPAQSGKHITLISEAFAARFPS